MYVEIRPSNFKAESTKAGFNFCGTIKGGIMNIAKLTMHFGATFETSKYVLKDQSQHNNK
jgi:hypothetical protein